MKRHKQNPDFLHFGERLLRWYRSNSRDLPWRRTSDPYRIWISEIILQQTQVRQGLNHYLNFVERFPTVQDLAEAETDEVLLYWKGLGYYSRALNLHTAAKQIVFEFNGTFPATYNEILKLKGVGKYTAAAIASICFNEQIPAVDGNFYRVLSRLFADNFDITSGASFAYFSQMALRMMPAGSAGDFNQAVMDLGSAVCRPRNPECILCPLNDVCVAFATGKVHDFPVKTRKTKVENLNLHYYFIVNNQRFLIRRRGKDFIWKNLYEFPTKVPADWQTVITKSDIISHKLTHRNLTVQIDQIQLSDSKIFTEYGVQQGFVAVTAAESESRSFPKPLESYIRRYFKN